MKTREGTFAARIRELERVEYRVHAPDAPWALKVGKHNTPAYVLMHRRKSQGAAFCTGAALSATVDLAVCQERCAGLMERLGRDGQALPGEAVDPTGVLPATPGVFAMGLDDAQAVAIAQEFGLDAYVSVAEDGMVSLRPLRELASKGGVRVFTVGSGRALMAAWIDVEQESPVEAALRYFERQSGSSLDAMGIEIVEGEHPGSSFYAAVLTGSITRANQASLELRLPVRFF